MNSEPKSPIFSVAFNPEAKFFNELINIESHSDFSDFYRKNKKAKFGLYINGQKQPKWVIIGIRESYGCAWAQAMSYLKFYFKENQNFLELLDTSFDKNNPSEIPIP